MNKIQMLREVEEIIETFRGMDDMVLHRAGVSTEECLDPTIETISKLKKYQSELTNKNERKNGLGI